MRLQWIASIVTFCVAMSSHAVPTVLQNAEAALPSIGESCSDRNFCEWLVLELASNFSSFYFQKRAEYKTIDVTTSPLSVFIPLSMLSYGARGETRAMFLDAIGLPENKTQMAKVGYAIFMNELAKYDVRIKTKIFVPSGVKLKPDFVDLCTKVFNSEIESVAVTDGSIDNNRIDEFFVAETNNNVKSLLKRQIARDPSIVLVNTVYFKGVWKTAFDSSLTQLRPFYLGNEYEKNVLTMATIGRFRHGRLDDFNADFIDLPYKSNGEGGAMSMFVILPDVSEDPTDWLYLIHKLRNMKLTRLLNSTEEELEVHLPKFKIETEQSLNSTLIDILNPDLSLTENHVNTRPDVNEMRVSFWSSFGGISPQKIEKYQNPETGDFSGISESLKQLNLGESMTKIVLEVDEKGEQAAESSGIFYKTAETTLADRKTRSVVQSPKQFKVNRPFYAMIVTKGEVLINIFSMFVPGTNFLRKGVYMTYLLVPWIQTTFYTLSSDGKKILVSTNL
ncbi:antichymotrypsin-2-like isoform X2 [Venturia canescens]|uniref:antichymotrypsin-2-like isoform X2 n=1 Tax=Venturia canescens TaxID=32260 RepID=UPI001C9C5956|nr:antichymotrypsin-2-like isoform X2 [Venturia canescens]